MRRNNNNYYYINYFITDSSYQLSIAHKENTLRIIPLTSTDLIEKGLGTTNRFGIEIINSLFTPVINGQKMAKAENDNIPNAGGSYSIIFVSRGDSAKIQFDNLSVQEVE